MAFIKINEDEPFLINTDYIIEVKPSGTECVLTMSKDSPKSSYRVPVMFGDIVEMLQPENQPQFIFDNPVENETGLTSTEAMREAELEKQLEHEMWLESQEEERAEALKKLELESVQPKSKKNVVEGDATVKKRGRPAKTN